MRRFLLNRALQSGVVLLGLSAFFFTILAYTPADPGGALAQANPEVQPEDVQRLRQYYGLDDPLIIRYVKWLRAVAHGDLGYSRTYGLPGRTLIGQRLGNTLLLVGTAFLIALVAGSAIGIYSALHQYSPADYGFTVFSFLGLAMPNFWQGIVLILIFAVWVSLFPAGGRAEGLPERRMARRHALRNALLPVITLVALSIPGVLNGAVLTETVFSWPGVGLLLFQAVLGPDFSVARAVLVFLALGAVGATLLADMAYAVVDPRIRYG